MVQPESASIGNSSAQELASGIKSTAVTSAGNVNISLAITAVEMTHIALPGMQTTVSFSSGATSDEQTVAHHHRDPVGVQEPVNGDQSAVLSSLDSSDYSDCTHHATPLQGTQSPGTADNVFIDRRPLVDCTWCSGKRKAANPLLDNIPKHRDKP